MPCFMMLHQDLEEVPMLLHGNVGEAVHQYSIWTGWHTDSLWEC